MTSGGLGTLRRVPPARRSFRGVPPSGPVLSVPDVIFMYFLLTYYEILARVTAVSPLVPLVARLHVDLRLQASALCPR